MALEHLRKLHENYSDEIPDQELHGEGNFKVRRNWWHGVIGDLDNLRTKGMIPPDFKRRLMGLFNITALINFTISP